MAHPADFERAKALFFDGLAHFEAGRIDAAATAYEASLAILPGRPSTLVNLAAARLKQGCAAQALAALDAALGAAPQDIDALSHRATALKDLGRDAEALAAYDCVLAREPQRTAAWFQRGLVLQALGRPADALASYDHALALDATLALAWSQRGGILLDMRRAAEAAQAFERALALGADADLNGYFLAAARAAQGVPATAPPTAPKAYVATLFDQYAHDFDAHLVGRLQYRSYATLVEHVQAAAPGRRFRHALDLGCGTGLSAPLLAPLVDRLDGVDLSQGMLAQARARGLYRELACADVAEHLHATAARHDLVFAADVFVYVGDLEHIFAGVRRVIEPGGVFAFTVERSDGAQDFELRASLRYAHAEGYLRALAGRHAMPLRHLEPGALREDQGRAVQGLYVVLAAA